jgi:hypothetical protein
METHAYLAKIYHEADRKTDARERLRMAATLQSLRLDESFKDTLEDIAGTLGGTQRLSSSDPEATYRALGFIHLEAKPMTVEREIAVGQPVFADFDSVLGPRAVGCELKMPASGRERVLDLHADSGNMVSRETVSMDAEATLLASFGAYLFAESTAKTSRSASFRVLRREGDRFVVRFEGNESPN